MSLAVFKTCFSIKYATKEEDGAADDKARKSVTKPSFGGGKKAVEAIESVSKAWKQALDRVEEAWKQEYDRSNKAWALRFAEAEDRAERAEAELKVCLGGRLDTPHSADSIVACPVSRVSSAPRTGAPTP